MHAEAATKQDAIRESSPAAEITQAVESVSHTRDAINLRLLLELRRRLKSAAEKELAIGADRMRAVRTELHRTESELRLCACALETRAGELSTAMKRVRRTQSRAEQTCARLSSLEKEHDDLSQQLGDAQRETARLRQAMQSGVPARSGTLDSFVIATAALMSDLSHAIKDESALKERGRNLIEQADTCAARARFLKRCLESANRAITSVRKEVCAALDGLPG